MTLLSLGLTTACGCTNFVANRNNADGVTLFQRGQYQDALVQFRAATYADPANADGYYNLGATYHRLARAGNQNNYLRKPKAAIGNAWNGTRTIGTATAGWPCC